MGITKDDLTLAEKAALVNGGTFFSTAKNERLGIERARFLDGGTGLNYEQLFGDFCSRRLVDGGDTKTSHGSMALYDVSKYYYEPDKLGEEALKLKEWIAEQLKDCVKGELFAPGCFPAGILLGATWNPSIVQKIGEAIGREAKVHGVHLLLGTPYVNLMRDPKNGRLFEGFSEDPYHLSSMAAPMVTGVQNQGVAADVKHFAANNQESFRVGVDELISRRALEELYFPAFRACVKAGVATVMSAYNSINGEPCTESDWLLHKVLREEWGFEGLVISDWGAVANPAKALAGGTEIAMPGPRDATPIIDAIENGELSEDALDRAVEHILAFVEKWVCDEDVTYDAKEVVKASNKIAYDAVVEGAVLLKNDNDIFPLQGGVSLFGEGATGFFDCGTGSAGITTDRTSSLYDALKHRMGDNKVVLEEMTEDTVLIVVRQIGMEGNDRATLELPEAELNMLLDTIQLAKRQEKKIGVILNVCGPVDCRRFISDIDGLFCIFLPGMEGANALADLLVGNGNPSGKLPITFPYRYEDTPTCINFPGDGRHVIYGEDIFVGYRYYDYKDVDVLYPFGYGMSYTSFSYSAVGTSSDIFQNEVTVSVDVTNTGDRSGKQVISLYVHDVKASIRKPIKELKAFEKIELAPGETKTVSFVVKKDMLASFDPNLEKWEAEEGYYDMILATSVKDVIGEVRVYGDWTSAYSWSEHTVIKEVYDLKEANTLLFDTFQEMQLDCSGIYSNYEYTPHVTMKQLFMEAGLSEVPESFLSKLKQIKRM